MLDDYDDLTHIDQESPKNRIYLVDEITTD